MSSKQWSRSKIQSEIQSPFCEHEIASLHCENRTVPYQGTLISYRHLYYTCHGTGTKFTTTPLDAINLDRIGIEYEKL